MGAKAAKRQDTLTAEQLEIVERARNTPVVISRSRRRSPDITRWTFEPRIKLARDIDIRELLDRGRYAESDLVERETQP